KLQLDAVDFSLRDSLGDAVKTLAVRAQQKGLELTFHVAPDVPNDVRGDPGRLQQVVLNLVGNAIKFTERGEIAVEVQHEDATGDPCRLEFSVRDTGIGIP